MRRAANRTLWGLAAACVTITLLVGAVWMAGNTQKGRHWIEALTFRLSGGVVKLQGFGGSFPVDLTLERLELRDATGVWLTADHVALRWSPLELLQRRIDVDELHAARVHMERTPAGGKQGGSAPSVPHIEVEHFTLDVVELGAPLVGTAASLAAGGRLQIRSLEDANVDLDARRLNGEGGYSLHARLDPKRLDASLNVHEPASGPLENLLSLPGLGALSATLTLAGPRTAERIDAMADAGSLHAQVHGSIDLTHWAADAEFSLEAAAMAPRPDVSWSRIALKGSTRGQLSSPTADGFLTVEDLRIAADTRIPKLTAQLSAAAGKLAVQAVVDALEIPGPQPRLFAGSPFKVAASLLLDQPALPVELTAAHPLLSLHARADLRAPGGIAAIGGAPQRASIELRIPEIAPFAAFAGQDMRGSADIDAQLKHTSANDAVTLDASLALGGGAGWVGLLAPRANLKLSGSLSQTELQVESIRLTGGAATLTASGSAARTAATSFAASFTELQGSWQIEVVDLSRLSGAVAGDMKMSGQIKGPPSSLAADAQLTSRVSVHGSAGGVLDAQLHLRGLPKSPSGAIQAHGLFDGAPLVLDAAVELGQDRSFSVQVHDAEWKSVHLDGGMKADAKLTDSHGQLHLRVADLRDFNRILDLNIAGSVEGSVGFVPAQGHTEAQGSLDVKNLSVGGYAGNVQMQAVGVSNAIALQFTAQVPELYGTPAELSAAGLLNLDARELRADKFAVGYRGENFHLLAPAQLSFAHGASIDELRFGAQQTVLALSGQISPTLDINASLKHVNAAVVNVFWPRLMAGGLIEGSAELAGRPASPTGKIQIDASDVRFADDAALGLPAVEFHSQAKLADDTASIEATLAAGTASRVTASGTIPLNPNGALDMKVGGKLDVGLVNPLLEARGLRATGALTVDATVTGSSTAPQVGGGITLADGSLRDYAHGAALSNITAEVVGKEGGLQIKSFKAKAVSGTVTATGTLGVLQHEIPIDLQISAQNAQVVSSSIITANLDGDLRISGTALERVDVAGKIHVNKATIGIPDSLPPDVAVLDVRRRGKPPPAIGGKQLVVGIDVVIQAPQQIIVQGRGLDAELGGEIKLSGTSQELSASGGFNLQRGSFTIAGSNLSFTQGRVGFDGAGLTRKIDPTLDFTAQTVVSGSTVGDATTTLRITGFADGPQFEFTSIPALPQDEIMALLLFGKPASQLSTLEVAEIGAALATLSGVGGGGSNPLVKLQRSLGLDRLTVGSNTTTSATGAPESSGAAIAAGRYVSKRVYIEAKQTTAGTSQVQVNVDLTKHLKLQTRLGNGTASTQGTTPDNDPGSSIGLSYQFEY